MEMYLAKRLSAYGSQILIGVTDHRARMVSARAAICAHGIAEKPLGKNAAGVVETYGHFFARLYGEAL